MNEKYAMCINVYYWLIERNHLVDLVPYVKDNDILITISKPPEFDAGLYIRPFRYESIYLLNQVSIQHMVHFEFPQK